MSTLAGQDERKVARDGDDGADDGEDGWWSRTAVQMMWESRVDHAILTTNFQDPNRANGRRLPPTAQLECIEENYACRI